MRILWIARLTLNKTKGKMASPHLFEIPPCLRKRGHEVELLVPRFSKKIDAKLPPFLRIRFLPSIPKGILTTLSFWIILSFYLPYYIITKKPDVIVVEYLAFPGTISATFFHKTLLILDIRTRPVETRQIRGLVSKLIYFPTIALAKSLFDGITATSRALKEEICKVFRISAEKVGVWNQGVSLSLFNSSLANKQNNALRRKFGFDRKFILFYHGTLSQTRGLQETIEAIALLKAKHPNIVFFILGNGEARSELNSLISTKKLQSNVFIFGPVDYYDVPKYVSMSDVCIIPLPNISWWRAASTQKITECLAMGKPVIATDIPFHLEVMQGKNCGLIIGDNKPRTIAAAILKLYNSKLDKMQLEARRVAGNYSWQKIAEDFEQFLKRRVGNG